MSTAVGDVVWDGVLNSYIPEGELQIGPGVELHRHSTEVDAFLFEVLRHNLWTINDEHGTTILKISGSPIATTAEDFQTAILTEDAEFVFFGPRIQTQSGTMDLAVKWILENRADNPGIEKGDVFLCNDPWIGATHQQDVGMFAPVFWEDKIFCWVGNALHQYDIGGSTPGGFCPDATDTFVEPISIPGVKIVEGGTRRADIADFYLRHSRMPDLVALDMRAQIAGNVAAVRRIESLLERYGPDQIKGVMRKIIDDGERIFADRLAAIPDGTWASRSYLEVALDGDRNVYPVEMQVEKLGEELTFSMDGTAEQVGALNIGFATWRSGVLTAVNPTLCYDLLYATGGPLRRMRFRPTPGTLFCATRPASVSNAQIGVCLAGGMASAALGRMLASDEKLAAEVFAPGGTTQFPIDSLSGIDQWGNPYGTILLDPMLGGTGAFTNRDGIDTGGCWWDPRSLAPNVEENEQHFPILYLYRREWEDSGGAGRHRGGNSAVLGFVAHGTEEINHSTSTSGLAVPTSEGLFGGAPASACRYRFLEDSGVRARFAAGSVPTRLEDLEREPQLLGGKQRGLLQHPDDVMEIAWCAGGGIGDPLEREPEAVATDLRHGNVTAHLAEDVYGVIVKDADVDAEATASRREQLRRERAEGGGDVAKAEGELALSFLGVIDVRGAAGSRHYACSACEADLGLADGVWKDATRQRETPIEDAVPHMPDPAIWVDAEMVQRDFFCPGCKRLLSSEIVRAEDPPLADIRIAG